MLSYAVPYADKMHHHQQQHYQQPRENYWPYLVWSGFDYNNDVTTSEDEEAKMLLLQNNRDLVNNFPFLKHHEHHEHQIHNEHQIVIFAAAWTLALIVFTLLSLFCIRCVDYLDTLVNKRRIRRRRWVVEESLVTKVNSGDMR